MDIEEIDLWMLSYILKYYEDNPLQKLVLTKDKLVKVIERENCKKQFLAMVIASLAKLDLIDDEILASAYKQFINAPPTLIELGLLFYATSLLSKKFSLTESFLDFTIKEF